MAENLAPVDTSVTVPASVKAAAEAAEAAHKAAYPPPAPEPPPEAPPAQPEALQLTQDAPAAPPETPPAPPALEQGHIPESGETGSWEHRFHGMRGRFEQSQKTLEQMQDTMTQLGDELMRTQQALQFARRGNMERRQQPPQRPQGPPQTVTKEDIDTYGPELIDLVTRAARGAVAPDLQQVTRQVRHTSQQVALTAQQRMEADLDRVLPQWREINVSPRFKQWVSLRDVYSNAVRRELINDAAQAADAPRLAAFFNAFLDEERATGQLPATTPPPPQDTPPAPRAPAVPISSLAAPGRARPASGNGIASTDKPVFTLAQVKAFYSNEGRKAYVGRDADRQRDEQMIIEAQREGRVR